VNRLPYQTDLSDKEWEIIELHLPQENSGGKGRPRLHSIREILNAIFYIVI
jgi:putative transposase